MLDHVLITGDSASKESVALPQIDLGFVVTGYGLRILRNMESIILSLCLKMVTGYELWVVGLGF